MNDFDKIIKKLTFVIDNIESITAESIRNSSDVGVKLQQSQMLLGLASNNKKIGVYRDSNYRNLKKQMNPDADGFVDLRLTGAFYRAIKIDVTNSIFTFTSNDSKTGKLLNKYGDKIFGLNDNYRQQFYNQIEKEFNKIIKKI